VVVQIFTDEYYGDPEQAQRVAERQAAAARRDRDRAERGQYTPPAMGWRERVALAQEA
jgi:hypothetical protein